MDVLGEAAGDHHFATGNHPRSVTVGHLNGDGNRDLAVANSSSHNVSVLLGDGSGGFASATDFAAGSNPIWLAVGDFNGGPGQVLADGGD